MLRVEGHEAEAHSLTLLTGRKHGSNRLITPSDSLIPDRTAPAQVLQRQQQGQQQLTSLPVAAASYLLEEAGAAAAEEGGGGVRWEATTVTGSGGEGEGEPEGADGRAETVACVVPVAV